MCCVMKSSSLNPGAVEAERHRGRFGHNFALKAWLAGGTPTALCCLRFGIPSSFCLLKPLYILECVQV